MTGAETGKQPYLVFAKEGEATVAAGAHDEENNIEMFAKATLSEYWSESKECWTGPRPLFIAGLYSLWYSKEDRYDKKKPVFSYTVITR